MHTQFVLDDAPLKRQRVKKLAKPVATRVSPAEVVDRLYRDFPSDMARLAE